MTANWEYLFENLGYRDLTTEHLNTRAAEGWELVSTAVAGHGGDRYLLFWRR
jgi:hypothetical protein